MVAIAAVQEYLNKPYLVLTDRQLRPRRSHAMLMEPSALLRVVGGLL
jgi:hypothetical protein